VSFVIDTASNNDMYSDVSCNVGNSGNAQLRRRVVEEKKVETFGPLQQEEKSPKPHTSVKDPLKWFGLLVPPSLRTAQKNFIEGKPAVHDHYYSYDYTAVDLSCQLASAQAKVEHYRKLYLTLEKDKAK